MILETPRLLLRELYLEDAEALQEIVSDPRVTRYLPFDPQTLEQTRKYIEGAMRDQNALPRAAYDLAIMVRGEGDEPSAPSQGHSSVPKNGMSTALERWDAEGGQSANSSTNLAFNKDGLHSKLIGRCGLGVNRPEHREGMIWYLLHPSQWGKGYAFEAASALLDFAFDTLHLHRVFADCDPRNTASCHVAEKLGMTMEGKLRENYYLKGEWCSAAMYGILEGERRR